MKADGKVDLGGIERQRPVRLWAYRPLYRYSSLFFWRAAIAVIGAAIFMWWFENHDEKTDSGNEKEGN